MSACENGHIEVMELLLDAGVEVNDVSAGTFAVYAQLRRW